LMEDPVAADGYTVLRGGSCEIGWFDMV